MVWGGSGCGLSFGAFFSKDTAATDAMRAADYLTVWLGTHSKAYGHLFNPYWHGRMLERVRHEKKTAVYYAYVIAMLARHAKGILDCDVGTPSLCVHGADFVREHEALILEAYDHYANRTAGVLGRQATVVWLMEPECAHPIFGIAPLCSMQRACAPHCSVPQRSSCAVALATA